MGAAARQSGERPRIDERLARRGGLVELLRAPAALYGAAARLRSALYGRRLLLSVVQVDLPVVSVGNLSAGGTGKTPMVAWLCERLAERGLAPGILSRGYGVREGLNDEARMLAERLPDVPHVQDPDRVAGAGELERRGVEVVVLDDGFQHRRLARDLDLVLVDATRPWGLPRPAQGGAPVRAFLPRGLLRESPRALGRADAVVVTRSDAVPAPELEALRSELRALAPGAAHALARHRPVGLRAIEEAPGGARAAVPLPLGALRGLTVDLLSGIGNPGAFEATATGLGAAVAAHRRFPDHHAFAPADLAGLGARDVLTTAKDLARLPASFAPSLAPARLLVLDVELDVTEGAEALGALLDGLPECAARRARRALHEGLHG